MAHVLALLLALLLGAAPSASAQQLGRAAVTVNAQTGTSYTVLNSDNGKLVTLNNASAVAVSLPQAGSSGNFNAGWQAVFMNLGAGTVTITPATSTIDGLAGGYTLTRYQAVTLTSNGSNYITSGRVPSLGSNGLVAEDQLPTATGGGSPVKGAVIPGTCLEMGGTGNKTISLTTNCRNRGFDIVIDGGGSAITTGTKVFARVPYACTITSVETVADQTGSIVVDLKKATYSGLFTTSSITASAKPTLSSARKAQDATLTGWTTSLSAGDWIEAVVDSASTVTFVTVSVACLLN